jgi:hypothetical protein
MDLILARRVEFLSQQWFRHRLFSGQWPSWRLIPANEDPGFFGD